MMRHRFLIALMLLLACHPLLGQYGGGIPADPVAGSRVIIIEAEQGAKTSEVIDKVVKALGNSITVQTQSAVGLPEKQLAQQDIEIELSLRPDTSAADLTKLIQGMEALVAQPVRIKFAPATAKENTVRIAAGYGVSAKSLEKLADYLQSSEIKIGRLSLHRHAPPAKPANNSAGDLIDSNSWLRRYTEVETGSIASLRRSQQQLEQATGELATRIRSLKRGDQQRAVLQDRLRKSVNEAFAAQQKLRRAELAEFARRVQQIGETLDSRDKIAAQIIDRRVTELLDPNFRWEMEGLSTKPTRPIGNPGGSAPRNNISVLDSAGNPLMTNAVPTTRTPYAPALQPATATLPDPSDLQPLDAPELPSAIATTPSKDPQASHESLLKRRLDLLENEFRSTDDPDVADLIETAFAYFQEKMAGSPASRQTVLKEYHDRIKKLHRIAKKRFEVGVLTEQKVLAFEVVLLDIEKQLAGAKQPPQTLPATLPDLLAR